MKVPPKRKGNLSILNLVAYSPAALNESPSEKEGKCAMFRILVSARTCPSMKVPPKRKGNANAVTGNGLTVAPLNESPSEKEGKFERLHTPVKPLY